MMDKRKNGFTLIELLIAMVVGLVIMGAIYAMMNLSQFSSGGVGRKVATQQDARAALDFLATEIRMASYNPSMSSTMWGNQPVSSAGTCPVGTYVPTFIKGRKGIQWASDNYILFAMDLNADGIIGYPTDNEMIGYVLDSNSQIQRGVIYTDCGTSSSLLTILGGAGSSTLVKNIEAGTPMFQYFDAAGNDISAAVKAETTAATGSTSINSIRRIRITIVADVETQGSQFSVSRKTYTTDVLVRNHVLSP